MVNHWPGEWMPRGLLCALVAMTGSAAADEVRLVAGDRLIGTVTGGTAEALQMDTPYAEGLVIALELVDRVITDETVTLKLANGDYLSGQLVEPPAGRRLWIANPRLAAPVEVMLGEVQTLFKGDPEALAREEERVQLSGRANVGLSQTRGNSETESYIVNAELRARTPNNRYSIAVEAYREEAAGETTKDRSLALLKYDHFLTEKAFLYSNASFEQDQFQDLNLRSALGLGGGYQFFESERRFLSLEGGVSYVNEDFDTSADDDFVAGRWALNFEEPLLEFMRFFHFQEGLLGVEDTEDYVIRTRTGLRFSLGGGLRATTQLNVDWDNTPAPGLEKKDETYLFTLGYEW